MTFVGVPWFIGGGAENPVEGARAVAYRLFDGLDGAANPADCKPHQSASPDANVVIDPGTLVVRNTKTGALQESYLCRNPDPLNVAIAPTGSGGGRVDLVYLQVDDPQYGADAPNDIVNGPYLSVKVKQSANATSTTIAKAITNGDLPAGTVGVAIALVTLPALTSNITNAMIADLRPMARDLRRERRLIIPTVTAAASLTSTAYATVGLSGNTVVVPTWATRMNICASSTVTINATLARAKDAKAKVGLTVDGVSVAEARYLGTMLYDGPTYTGSVSGLVAVADYVTVPTGPLTHSRAVTPGSKITLGMRGARDGSAVPGTAALPGSGANGTGGADLIFDVEFVEA